MLGTWATEVKKAFCVTEPNASMSPLRPTRSRDSSTLSRWLLLLLSFPYQTLAYTLDFNSTASAKAISKQLVQDMLLFYNGNEPGQVPGLLNLPYYWWYGGAMFGALIDYWYYTGDTTYNDITTQGMLFQVGANNDYMPVNQTRTEGNDDQGFWGLAAMTAAEYNFPNPASDQPQWLALAQAVFNTQAARWDAADCGGGLRWQIFLWNNGYDYKNSISQACFFALAARLALYTGNQTYADWAERSWDWMVHSKLLDQRSWYIFDGAPIANNCAGIVPYQWTYNAGGFILGAAALYNHTGNETWRLRLDHLLDGASVFFTGPNRNIMSEVACESVQLCDTDQQSFKAYLSRWLAAITKWAPDTYSRVMPLLRASAVAASAQCTGGPNGRMCGIRWNTGKWDGTTGLGQQLAVLEVVLATTIQNSSTPLTTHTGGTSVGDPSAGSSDVGRNASNYHSLDGSAPPLTSAANRAGAAILTIILIALLLATIFYLFDDECSDKTYAQRWAEFRSTLTTSATTTSSDVLHRGLPRRLLPLFHAGAVSTVPSKSATNRHAPDKLTFPSQQPAVAARNNQIPPIESISPLTGSFSSSRPVSVFSAGADSDQNERVAQPPHSVPRKPVAPLEDVQQVQRHPRRLASMSSPERMESWRPSTVSDLSTNRSRLIQARRRAYRAATAASSSTGAR